LIVPLFVIKLGIAVAPKEYIDIIGVGLSILVNTLMVVPEAIVTLIPPPEEASNPLALPEKESPISKPVPPRITLQLANAEIPTALIKCVLVGVLFEGESLMVVVPLKRIL
jgi:hypothetical protein